MLVMITPDKMRHIRDLTNKARTVGLSPEEVVELLDHVSQLTAHVEYLQEALAEMLDPEYYERSLQ